MLVIDASVAVKWAIPEPGSDRALALARQATPLIAPSLIVEEIGNLAWRRHRTKQLSREQALAVVRIATAIIPTIVPAQSLQQMALSLAMDLDHPIYDCFYVAVALREQAVLVTADEKLAGIAKAAGAAVALL